MPTDSLVDVEVTIKLVNVRKSQVEYANQLLRSLFHYEDLLYLQDKKTGSSPWDLNLTNFSLPRVIEDAPASVRISANKLEMPARVEHPSITPADPVEKVKPESGGATMPSARKYYEDIIAYVGEYPESFLVDIARHFKVNDKTMYVHLDNLVNAEKIVKNKTGGKRSSYSLKKAAEIVGPIPPEISKPLMEELKKAEPEKKEKPVIKGEFWSEKTKVSVEAKAPIKEAAAPKVIEPYKSACNAPTGDDSNVKAYLLKTINENPQGICSAQIKHDSNLSSQKVRNLLIELEEEHKIRRDMIETSPGVAKTAYFPAKVTTNGTGGN